MNAHHFFVSVASVLSFVTIAQGAHPSPTMRASKVSINYRDFSAINLWNNPLVEPLSDRSPISSPPLIIVVFNLNI